MYVHRSYIIPMGIYTYIYIYGCVHNRVDENHQPAAEISVILVHYNF